MNLTGINAFKNIQKFINISSSTTGYHVWTFYFKNSFRLIKMFLIIWDEFTDEKSKPVTSSKTIAVAGAISS